MVATGVLSVIVMLVTESEAVAGFCFWILGPLQGWHGAWSGKRTRVLRSELDHASATAGLSEPGGTVTP
jgi:hypothetical protein